MVNENMASRFSFRQFPMNLVGLFLAVRLMIVLALPLEGLLGYGDFIHFYRLAELGQPFMEYWVEFPPIFPFLSRILFQLSGGQEHTYDYLMVALLSIFQAGNLYLFCRIGLRIFEYEKARSQGWFYFGVLSGLSYGWWYFDPIAVFSMLLSVDWLIQRQDIRAGVAIGLGMLTKWFPALTIGAVWRFLSPRRAFKITSMALGLTLIVFIVLYVPAPDFTTASLQSQLNKGSWETVWALLDGNLHTGNFGAEIQRYDPEAARYPIGNPARIHPASTLAVFLLLGIWLFSRVKERDSRKMIAFLGLTWIIYLLWSPGWSPQWILFLIPITLLAIPGSASITFCLNLILVSLLEWPVLLSRARFDLLWVPVVLRTFLLVILGIEFGRSLIRSVDPAYRGGVL